jgi:hypothetical protein
LASPVWIRLEAWFGDKSLFIKDLMQDIRSVTPIKDGDDERLMDYYVMLQAHIAEARNADALDMLLIPANVELMVLPLTAWEKRVWREAQGRLPAEDRSWYMDVFVNERLRYKQSGVRVNTKIKKKFLKEEHMKNLKYAVTLILALMYMHVNKHQIHIATQSL